MLRRPPGEGRPVAQQPKIFLALAAILLPWLPVVNAQQQHQQQHRHHHDTSDYLSSRGRDAPVAPHLLNEDKAASNGELPILPRDPARQVRHESPSEGDRIVDRIVTTSSQHDIHLQQETQAPRRKSTLPTAADELSPNKESIKNPDILYDASALATLAPAEPVRAPSTPRQLPSLLAGAGLSSPQSARSLEDWEVEDYVLLATIDGHLYAVDRGNGGERWHLQVEQPTVETIHHNINRSSSKTGGPSREKAESPHPLDDYIWAVEPTTNGAVYVWTPSGVNPGLMDTGFTMKQLVDDHGPYAVQDPPVVYTGHKKTTMITLDAATGRVLKWFGHSGSQVDQTATCYRPDGRLLEPSDECSHSGTITLSRTEYVVTIHRLDDGRAIATLKYSEWGANSFDSDLHRQYRTAHNNRYITSKTDGKLYVLGIDGVSSLALKFSAPVAHVFDIARPEDAPAGSNPELVLLPQPAAPAWTNKGAHNRGHNVFLNRTEAGSWYAMSGYWYPLAVDAPIAKSNRRHFWESLKSGLRDGMDRKLISDALVGTHPLGNAAVMAQRPRSFPPTLPSEPANKAQQPQQLPRDSSLPSILPDNETNFPAIVNKVSVLPQYAIDRAIEFFSNPFWYAILLGLLVWRRKEVIRWFKGRKGKEQQEEESKHGKSELKATADRDKVVLPSGESPSEESKAAAKTDGQTEAQVVDGARDSPSATSEPSASASPTEGGQEMGGDASPEKKKKAHRGRRGGVKHRKGVRKQQDSVERRGESLTDIDEVIPGLQNVGAPPKLEPNVTTMSNDPEDVSGPTVQIGGIEVNQDEQLGMGSNGTVVFPGKFHGRDVAVKRMLTQFWDIATQETQLLLESDHHPNVIRYYAMSRNDSFLYIALELCQASLSDIIEKPHMFQELAQAGEVDIPRVLLQIAYGLSYLHDLRIVHRDLKPQNILVTMGRDGRPRLLVSDFGLCKKLEGNQSSFGATTAHAAGTSGWRAPELLVDDDARDGVNPTMASTHSDSSTIMSSSDMMGTRRATRSIDIFSLGLVFYYVLTKGSHPFDCGDRYMREVNIRKGKFNLSPLDVLGDVAEEAKALIEVMLRTEPKARPTAKDVMAHPFFWSPKERLSFLCDVSDHFELEPRDPPSEALQQLEHHAPKVCCGDFLKGLPREFVDSLGKQRKYTGTRFLDLLRALRNKRSHYGDLSDSLKKMVGPVPEGYLNFWTRRFPNLLVVCCQVIHELGLEETDTFKEYFKARKPQ